MIRTSAGSTPGTPPSSIPLPPYTFSRYFAPSCTAIRLVRKPRPAPRALLHEHAVPVAYQRLDSRRHQRHTMLGGFDLFGHSDNHAGSALRSCVTPSCYVFCATPLLDAFILSRAIPQFGARDQRTQPPHRQFLFR